MAHLYQSGKRAPIADINVVPFIDVMLVLLVIFMITTPLLTQGVKVNLPKTSAQAMPSQQKEPIIVTVDASGNLYLNLADKPNEPVTPRTLSYLVSQQLSQPNGDTRPVLVRGDKEANYGKVMAAMVLLQQAGAKGVGLVTQADDEAPHA